MTDEPAPAGMVPVVAAAPFPLHLAGEDRAAGWYGMAEAELAHRWAEWGFAIILPVLPREAPLALADLPPPDPKGEPLKDYVARAILTQPEQDGLPSVEDVRARHAHIVERDRSLAELRRLYITRWPPNIAEAPVYLSDFTRLCHEIAQHQRRWADDIFRTGFAAIPRPDGATAAAMILNPEEQEAAPRRGALLRWVDLARKDRLQWTSAYCAALVMAMHGRAIVAAADPVFAALRNGAWHVLGVRSNDLRGEAEPIGKAHWASAGARFRGLDHWQVEGLCHWDRLMLFGRTVQSEPAQAPAPAKGAGGRPSDFDILKISNEIRRVMEIDPDGMPQSSRERRDLVRRACLKVAGREPSDSHLPKIMDLLEIPR